MISKFKTFQNIDAAIGKALPGTRTHGFLIKPLVAAMCVLGAGSAVANDDDLEYALEEIVVTVGNREMRLIDTSVPVTTISSEDLLKQAPRSVADALTNIPSLQVNNALGNTNNDFRFRGIGAGGTQFLEFEEDGIPITRDGPDFLYRVPTVAMAGVDTVRGGNAPILRTAAIGAVVNFKYKEGSLEEHEGDVYFQTSDFGMRRTEVFFGGPLSDKVTYALSGYYTTDDGIREVDFPANEGYNIHASLKYHLADDSGYLKVSARRFQENNIVYLGTPVTGDLDSPRKFPGGPDITTGSILSEDIALSTTFSAPGVPSKLDLTDGNASDMSYVGTEFKKEWKLEGGAELELVSRNRYTDVKSDFAGYYSAGFAFSGDFQTGETLVPNMLNANTMGAGLVNYSYAMPAGFVPVGYSITNRRGRVLDQGTLNDANGDGRYDVGEALSTAASLANGNGIFMPLAAFDQHNPETSFQQDLELNITFETGEVAHYASLGYYYLSSEREQSNRQQMFLTDLQQQADRVDVHLVDAGGEQVTLTDGGFVTHNHWLNQDRIDTEARAYYATYEIHTGDLRVDMGVRYDDFSAKREFAPTTNFYGDGPDQTPLPEAGSVSPATTSIQRFVPGPYLTDFDYTTKETSWSLGANYLVTENIGVYARFTEGYLPARNGATATETLELGARLDIDNLQLAVNLFDMTQEGDEQDRGINIDGEDAIARIRTDRESRGIELEGTLDISENLRVTLSGTYQKPEFASGGSASLAPGSGITQEQLNAALGGLTAIDGKQIANQPEVLFNLGVEYDLEVQDWGVFYLNAKARHVGEAPVNDDNSRFFEAYTKWDAGVNFESRSGDWYARLNVHNLLDEDAIVKIEGGSTNTSLTGGDIGSDGFFGRSVQGRNVVLGVGYRF
jgi:outer membrane receptor protein involved in Fe transport